VPFSVLIFYAWHIGPLFEAAVRHPLIHALQHMCLIFAAVVVWWPALEPKKRRIPGELWKVPYVLGARFATMFLGMSLVVVRVPVYASVYGGRADREGVPWLTDQQAAAGIMITVDIIVMVAALCFFFARAASDAAREEEREQAARALTGAGPLTSP
jgi:putative copper resistance protein D